jgi:hypothetical protein
VRYKSAPIFQQALTDQIRNEARRSNQDHQWLRQLIAFERLLARLTEFAAEGWILKGGLALDIRLGSRARTTKDMDLAWRDTQEAAEAAFRKIEQHRSDDYFGFQIARTTLLDEADVGGTVRYLVHCQIGGHRYASFHLDVNFDGPILGAPDDLSGPSLLAFSNILPITYRWSD